MKRRPWHKPMGGRSTEGRVKPSTNHSTETWIGPGVVPRITQRLRKNKRIRLAVLSRDLGVGGAFFVDRVPPNGTY